MIRTAPGALALLLLSAAAASALGLDRSGQDVGLLFEDGNVAEFALGLVRPSLEGEDVSPLFPTDEADVYDEVGRDFGIWSYGVKYQAGDRLSVAAILDQPYGADVLYEGDPATSLLGGTSATLDSQALTVLGRYEFNESFSVHGGLRHVRSEAEVVLSGQAYGGLNGYRVRLEDGSGTGWVAGAAYERPAIALRVALTYQSEVELDYDTNEDNANAGPVPPGPVASDTTVIAPESWNLDLQTGIAPDTLLFGQIRHAAYADTVLTPDFFGLATGGQSITEIRTGNSYTLGLGRRLSDRLSASLSVGWEPASDDDLVSPLDPTNGQRSIQVGAEYEVSEAITIGGGVRYTKFGDAFAETGDPDQARATFEGSSALAVGLRVGYRF